MPFGLEYFLASLLSSKIAGKLGPHVLTLGSILTIVGYLLLGYSVYATGTSPNVGNWIPALITSGFGQALIVAPITNIVLSKIRKNDIGSALGVLKTGLQIASAIGIGLIGIIWLNALGHHADISQATAKNYTDAYIFNVYVLAAYTAFIFPLALILARGTANRMT